MKKKKFKEKDFKSVRFENGQVFFGDENYDHKAFLGQEKGRLAFRARNQECQNHGHER